MCASRDLNRLLGIGDAYHEIAAKMKKGEDEIVFAENFGKNYPDLLTQDWKQLAPELEYFQTASGGFLWVLQVIVMIALIFGIVNTMLMSVS